MKKFTTILVVAALVTSLAVFSSFQTSDPGNATAVAQITGDGETVLGSPCGQFPPYTPMMGVSQEGWVTVVFSGGQANMYSWGYKVSQEQQTGGGGTIQLIFDTDVQRITTMGYNLIGHCSYCAENNSDVVMQLIQIPGLTGTYYDVECIVNDGPDGNPKGKGKLVSQDPVSVN